MNIAQKILVGTIAVYLTAVGRTILQERVADGVRALACEEHDIKQIYIK